PDCHQDFARAHEAELTARDRFDGGRVGAEPARLLAEGIVVALETVEIARGDRIAAARPDGVHEATFAEQAVHEKDAGRKRHRVRPEPPGRLPPRDGRLGFGLSRWGRCLADHVQRRWRKVPNLDREYKRFLSGRFPVDAEGTKTRSRVQVFS